MFQNMEKISFLVFIFCVHHATGFFKLTPEQFASMPHLVDVDRFGHCVNKPGGLYCTAHADVVADGPNDLHFMMVNYTRSSERHYNYTQIMRGLCMSETCKKHVKGNSTPELMQAAESCINETMKPKYDLGVKVERINCYRYKEQKYQKDYIDDIVFYALVGIIALNFIATAYDVFFNKDEDEGYLTSFSMRYNWKKLAAPITRDPRMSQLVGINCIRAVTTALVVLGHSPFPHLMAIENPEWLEDAQENYILQTMFQGHIITQTFFTVSGLLLAYNVQVLAETRKITWHLLPKGIFLRWLRLLPLNVLALSLTTTWLKFIPLGPFYAENIGMEVDDCRQNWPSVVFYYGNYVDSSVCSLQNWSLYADMHLHIIAIAIITLSPTVRARNRALLVFFIISLLLPALEVYFRDMEPTLLVVAHAVRWYMTSTRSFKYMYKRTHTNMTSFVLGMFFGYLIYDLQKKPLAESTRKRLQYAYWLVFPVLVVVAAMTAPLFLNDGPRAPMWLRILYSMLQRPLFGLCVALIITGLVAKVEDFPLYRWFLESPLFVPISKMAYSIFAVHVLIIRWFGGANTTLSHVNMLYIFQQFAGIFVGCVLFGFFVYIMIESPFNQLLKLVFIAGPKTKASAKSKEHSVYQNEKTHVNGNSVTKGVQTNGETKLIKGE